MNPQNGDLIMQHLRYEAYEDRTLGWLTVPGLNSTLHVLEDRLRAPGVKVNAETAISDGLYRVILTKSPTLKRITPEVLDVPNFTTIRYHCGVRPQNTKGCPLLSANGVTSKEGLPILIFDGALGERRLVNFLQEWISANPNGRVLTNIKTELTIDNRKDKA